MSLTQFDPMAAMRIALNFTPNFIHTWQEKDNNIASVCFVIVEIKYFSPHEFLFSTHTLLEFIRKSSKI